MADPYRQLGHRIRALRQYRRLTQAQLAERVGVSDNFVGLIERGRGHPTLGTIGRMAEALQVPLQDLFLEDERPRTTRDVLDELSSLLQLCTPEDAQLVLAIAKVVVVRTPVRKSD